MVDNLVYSFGLQIDNGIPIKPFINEEEDTELERLAESLKDIKPLEDVRLFIKKTFNFEELYNHVETMVV